MENKFMDTKDGRESRINWEIGIDPYTLLCMKQIKLMTTSRTAQGTQYYGDKWEGYPKER